MDVTMSEQVTVEFGDSAPRVCPFETAGGKGGSGGEESSDIKGSNASEEDEGDYQVSLIALLCNVPTLCNHFSGDNFNKGKLLDLTEFSYEAGEAFINLVTMMSEQDENPGFQETFCHAWHAMPIIAKYCCRKMHDFVYDLVLSSPLRKEWISDNDFAWAVLEYDLYFLPGTEMRRPNFPTQEMLKLVVLNLAKPFDAKSEKDTVSFKKSSRYNRTQRSVRSYPYSQSECSYIDGVPIDLNLPKFKNKLSNELLVKLSMLLTAFV